MFCTQCGTQVDEGSNFCKNCGASMAKRTPTAADLKVPDHEPIPPPSPIRTGPWPRPGQSSISETQALPISPLRQDRGFSKSVIAAAGVAVIVIAAAGLHFGTDVFRNSPSETPPPTPEPMAKVVEPAAAALEVAKVDNPPVESDLNAPLWSGAPPEAPRPVQDPKPKPAAQAQRSPSQPAAVSSRPAERGNRTPVPAIASRRSGSSGTYETIRSTPVFEQASGSSRVVSNIDGGIKVTVVGSSGEWLEVRSRFGNPPGFIRRDDARPVERTE